MSDKLEKLYREVFGTPAGQELLSELTYHYILRPNEEMNGPLEGRRALVLEMLAATGKPLSFVKEATYVDYDPEEV